MAATIHQFHATQACTEAATEKGLRIQDWDTALSDCDPNRNNQGFSMLLAGGGIRGGMTYGSTDDFGFRAVENPVDPNDIQATVLNQLGLDHMRLTYRYSGCDFRLTDVNGRVIKEILA